MSSRAHGHPTPACNTGVVTPRNRPTHRLSIDWLSWTTADGTSPNALAQWVDPEGTWVQADRGMHGYRRSLINGHLRILYDGAPGMPPHLIVSGKGCAQLANGSMWSWLLWIACLHRKFGGQPTRVDFAWDVLDDHGIWDNIQTSILRRHYTCRSRSVRHVESWTNGARDGATWYLGSRQSETMVRIYDKQLEQGTTNPWVRIELELKGTRATQALRAWVARALQGNEPEGHLPVRLLAAHLQFRAPGEHHDRCRWEVAPWWRELLQDLAPLRLWTPPPPRTIDGTLRWLRHQVAPALALVTEAFRGDMAPVYEMLQTGRQRLRPELLALAAAFDPWEQQPAG